MVSMPSPSLSPRRAVLLGQHPSRVKALSEMINGEDKIQIVAGVSDVLDCGVVLNAQIPPVDLLICGAYFDMLDVKDMIAGVNYDGLQMIKVPEGLMMEGGGPLAVKAFVYDQLRTGTYYPLK
ncbi:hypothetical protein JCM10212_000618 [Sporobolomyces blumeae]